MVTRHLHADALRWIEGRLLPADRRRVGAHLAACPDCRAELAGTADVAGALRAMSVALERLSPRARSERAWRSVWERAQRGLARAHPAWQIAFSMSVATAFFALSSLWPVSSIGGLRSAVTGIASAPVVTPHTPLAPEAAGSTASLRPPATRARSASTAAPLPVPTPIPAPRG